MNEEDWKQIHFASVDYYKGDIKYKISKLKNMRKRHKEEIIEQKLEIETSKENFRRAKLNTYQNYVEESKKHIEENGDEFGGVSND